MPVKKEAAKTASFCVWKNIIGYLTNAPFRENRQFP